MQKYVDCNRWFKLPRAYQMYIDILNFFSLFFVFFFCSFDGTNTPIRLIHELSNTTTTTHTYGDTFHIEYLIR